MPSHIYLVMEYCNGGDLGDYLIGMCIILTLKQRGCTTPIHTMNIEIYIGVGRVTKNSNHRASANNRVNSAHFVVLCYT